MHEHRAAKNLLPTWSAGRVLKRSGMLGAGAIADLSCKTRTSRSRQHKLRKMLSYDYLKTVASDVWVHTTIKAIGGRPTNRFLEFVKNISLRDTLRETLFSLAIAIITELSLGQHFLLKYWRKTVMTTTLSMPSFLESFGWRSRRPYPQSEGFQRFTASPSPDWVDHIYGERSPPSVA